MLQQLLFSRSFIGVGHCCRRRLYRLHKHQVFSYWSGSGNDDDDDDDSAQKNTKKIVEIVDAKDKHEVAPINDGDRAPNLPHVLVIPTMRRPLFPGVVLPMTIMNPEVSKALVALKDSGQPYVGVFLKKVQDPLKSDDTELITDVSQVYSTGSFARIDNILRFDNSSTQVLMVAHRRIHIDDVYEEGPPIRANVSNVENQVYDASDKMVKAYSNEIVATLREVVKLNPLFKEHMQYFSERIDIHNPYKLADFAASVTTAEASELQAVLEEVNCVKRLKLALVLIMKELELSKVQQSIKEQVEERVSKNQRRFLLMEQLKTIKQELGMEKDDKDALVTKYRERIAESEMPATTLTVAEEELDKLEMLEKNSAEFNVTRNYLDWLTSMPWNKSTEENFDIEQAKTILDEDHYGLQDIKERILEFIAVSKLNSSVQGKILCLVGPPGTGKTSIGKSIARALNREFYRFSVGGLSDVAEIKGHRRTYIGAMPGKVIQCLKTTQSSNPVILIDEIDKLGRGHSGDPASALLELLDPGQNETFNDHYLDVPVDLSKVLFICTANVSDTIPGPLQDRMELLRLSGYDSPEKVAIAKQYLIPKAQATAGLSFEMEHTPKDLSISDDAISCLIKQYCREAGVRNLQTQIEKIFRKVALKVVTGAAKSFVIQEDSLDSYVGKPIFTSDRMYDVLRPGVVMGLAWTSMGGSSLYIETTTTHKSDGKGSLHTTGQMGSVMEESTQIAHTFARHHLLEVAPENKFFDVADVHMHIPEGATPKDGPSAGCTMVTALLSLAMGRPVLKDLAMTGEISLIGKVMPVGGIKEKTIAARRAQVKTLVLPIANQRDFHELPDYLKDGLVIHFADYYEDVYKVAFP